MKTVNNKTTFNVLAEQIEELIESKKSGSIKQLDIQVAVTVSKLADSQVKLLNYELQRAIRKSLPIRELESKPFDNTI